MKKQSSNVIKPILCENHDILYRLDFLDHNEFIFLLLSYSAKKFLENILKKADYNCEFVILYRQKNIIYIDNSFQIDDADGGNIKEETTNLDNLFPDDKYNYNVLKQTVDYFNRAYELERDDLCYNTSFNRVYNEFLNYYTILYDVKTNTDKLNGIHFSYYHSIENNNNEPNDNNSASDLECLLKKGNIDIYDRDLFRDRAPVKSDSSCNELNELNELSDNFSNNVIGFGDKIYINYQDYKANYSIYYCSTFNFSVIMETNSTEFDNDYLGYYFSNAVKLELIKKIDIDYEKLKQCNELFNNTYIDSKDLLIKNIEYYENYILKSSTDITTEHIESFIRNFYDVDDNKDNKIKSSELLELIARNITRNSFIYSRDKCIGIRNKISKKLIEIGLKKFRLADGYYFYGLKRKCM